MKILKKVLAAVLSVAMALDCVPVMSILASESGSIGDSLTYNMDDDGKLIISGTGDITSYSSSSNVPWYSYRSSITAVVIEDGVTSIGDRVFYGCTNLSSIAIPNSVTSIGNYAFYNCSSLSSIAVPESVISIGSTAFSGSGLTTVYCYEGSAADNSELYSEEAAIVYLDGSSESDITEGEVDLIADDLSLNIGESGDINISLQNVETPVNNLTFYVTFDPSVAEVSAVKMMASDGSLYDAADDVNFTITSSNAAGDSHYTEDMIGKTAFEAGVIKIAFVYGGFSGEALKAFDTDTTVAQITFTGVSQGSTAAALEVVDCNNIPLSAEITNIKANTTNGTITVSSPSSGSYEGAVSYIDSFSSSSYAEGDLIYSDDILSLYAATALTLGSDTTGEYLRSSLSNTNYTDTDGNTISTRLLFKVTPTVTGNITVTSGAVGKTGYVLEETDTEGVFEIISTTSSADTIMGFLTAGNTYYIAYSGTNPKVYSFAYAEGSEAVTAATTEETTTEITTADLTDINDVERAAPGTASDGGSHTLWIVGDSTGCYYNETSRIINRNGFGMALGDDAAHSYTAEYKIFDNENLTIQNLAVSGRSSLDYLTDNNYTTLTSNWKEGDYLIIAFGHNDEKNTDSARFTDASMGVDGWNTGGQFAYSLYANYLLPAVQAGVTPILATPILRRTTSSSGPSGSNVHNCTSSGIGDYRQTIIDLGEKFGISVIDNTYNTYMECITLGAGDCTISDDKTSCETTGYAQYQSVQTTGIDNTHSGALGAKMIAYFMGQTIKGNEIEFGITGDGSSSITSILTDGSADNGNVFSSLSTFFGEDADTDPRTGESSDEEDSEIGESFLWWFDEVNNGGTVSPGTYYAGMDEDGNYAAEITVVPGLSGESYSPYSSAALEYTDGTTHCGYWASSRPSNAGSLTSLPTSGSSYYFKLNTAGTVTVYNYVPSGKNFFVKDFDESLTLVNTTTTSSMNGNGNDSLTFAGEAGHTYLVTTGGTNGLRFYGFKFLKDEPVQVPVNINIGENVDFSKAAVSFTDVDTGEVYATVVNGQSAVILNAGHTYSVSVNDSAIEADCNGETEFIFTGSEASIDINLTDVPDVILTGPITSANSDNAAANVTSITFTRMSDETVSYTTTDIDETTGTYSIVIKPGEYNTSVVTTDGSVTYDRVSVPAADAVENEIYLELNNNTEEIAFTDSLSVPGDYDTLNEAITAINSMTDRPDGEEGRVTITLTSDLQEQVYMDADYVTLDGQGLYEVTWYYGIGSAYYSVDSSGLYSETLFRDKYSKNDSSGSLWGGVMLVYGDYFLAHDVTFRNTYNYEVTDKEIEDGVTPTDGKKERTKTSDVTVSSMRERSNALYTYGNYCEYKNCNILSSQDTLGINGTLLNYTYFTNCTICGNCDYICGAGTMLFDNCTLLWKTEGSSSLGYITAPKFKPYIFRNCIIEQDGSNYAADSTGYYGRPWDAAAYAIYYQCETNDLIRYDGWYDMSSNSADNAYFYEYNNLASDGSVFMSARGKDLNDEEYADILAAVEGDNIIDGMLGGWTPVYYELSSESKAKAELAADTVTIKEGESGDINISLQNIGTTVNNLTFYASFDPDTAAADAVKKAAADGTLYDVTSDVNITVTSAEVLSDPEHYTTSMIGKTAFEAGIIKLEFIYGDSETDSYAFDTDTVVAQISFTGLSEGVSAVELEAADCSSIVSGGTYISLNCSTSAGNVKVRGGSQWVTADDDNLYIINDDGSITISTSGVTAADARYPISADSGEAAVTGTINVSTVSSSVTYVQILNSSGVEVIGVRCYSGCYAALRLGGSDVTLLSDEDGSNMTWEPGTEYTYTINADLSTGVVSLTVTDGSITASAEGTYSGGFDNLSYVKIASKASAAAEITASAPIVSVYSDSDDTTEETTEAAAETTTEPSAEQFITAGSWKAATFGNACDEANIITTDGDGNTVYKNRAEAIDEKTVNMHAEKGKISDGSATANSEGIVFYYQPVSLDEDFTISATATVNDYSQNNQVAFGLEMRDQVFDNMTNPSQNLGSSIAVGGFRLGNGTLGAKGFYYNEDGGYVSSNTSEKFPTDYALFTGSDEELSAGDSFKLKLSYNSALGIVTINFDGDISTLTIAELESTLNFEDEIYVGSFVARDIDVTFTNLKLTVGQVTYEAGEWKEGQSYHSGNPYTVTPDDYDNPTTVSFSGGAGSDSGKLTDNDEEYAYYVNELDEDANFTLSATVSVDAMSLGAKNQNQTAFGIVFRSTTDTSDASYTESTGANRHTPSLMLDFVPYTKITTAGDDYTGVNIRTLDKTASSAGYVNIYNTASEYISEGQTYDISVTKTGTAYLFTVTDNQTGETYTNSISGLSIFSGTIYPGFFAARNVDVTYSNISLEIDNRVVTGLEITTPPEQTEYYIGEKLNLEGMAVTAVYDDGSSEVIDDYAYYCDTSVLGDTVITVSKGSASAEYPVTVRKMYVTDISLSYEPLINRYYEYQLFTYEGIEGIITFENGETEKISDDNVEYTVDGSVIDSSKYWLSSDSGSKTVYISYVDTDTVLGNGAAAEYNIEVYPYSLTEISVSSEPYKTSYATGDEFVSDGLQIMGIYSDGTNIYSDVLSADAYTLSGFNSKTTGTKVMTVKLKADTSIKTTFSYTIGSLEVSDCRITSYPKTSYVTGTAVSEIEDEFLNNLVITIYYNNGTTETLNSDEISAEFSIDTSEVNTAVNGVYPVYVTPVYSELPTFTVNITIWNGKDFYWNCARFGASSSGSGIALTNGDEYDLAESAYIYSVNGTGKITNSYHDGIAYYYTRIDADNNFTISGDVEVESYLPNGTNSGRQGQEAFGIMARDVIPLTPADDYSSDSETFEGLGTTVVVQTENAKKDSNGEPVPLNTGADFFSNIVLAGGYTYESYGIPDNPPTARQIEKANSNRIKLFIRYGVKAWDGSDVASAGSDIYTLYDGSEFGDYITTYDQLATTAGAGECFYPKPGDIYHIELTRLNNGYYVSTTILAVGEGNADYADTVVGMTFSKAWEYSEEDPLTVQNEDTIYAGFFAARYASINVSNIAVYESSTDTDLNSAESDESKGYPSLSLKSDLYTYDTDYTLVLSADNTYGGNVIIKLGDQVIANGAAVGTDNTAFSLSLENDNVYDLVIAYTPSKKDSLASYDTVTYRYTLYCLGSAEAGDIIYAAPEEGKGISESGVYGTFSNKGTKDSPLDIDTALAIVESGQTIVLLNGTYYRDEVIDIKETNYGTSGGYKTLKAETDGSVIIDMQRNDQCISIDADYWWIKGIKFLNSAVSVQGGGLSGSHCIVEGCVFAESGSTGFQISGSDSDSFELWPSYNLIVYCESYNSAAGSTGTADGFGCKLAIGNGNTFKNCVSHNNEDDGWDLYTKTSSGPIGAVLIEDCISYDDSYYLVTEDNVGADMLSTAQFNIIYGSSGINKSSVSVGDKFLYQSSSASGNGFKLGGESVYVQHYIKDSFAFGNKAKGFDSNSNPAMKVRNCISYNNGTWKKAVNTWGYTWSISNKTPSTASNFGFYSGVTDKVYNYNLDGAISLAASQYDQIASYSYEAGEATNQADSAEALTALYSIAQNTDPLSSPLLTLNKTLKTSPVNSRTNYLVGSTSSSESSAWGYTREGYEITGYAGYNSEGKLITPDWFVSLDEADGIGSDGFIINHNAGGSYDLGNFLKLTSDHIYLYASSDIPDYSDTYTMFFGKIYQSGDIDGDGNVDLADTISILKYINDQASFTKSQLKLADINGDGQIDKADAALALKKAILNS